MRNQIQVKPQVNRLIKFLSQIEEGKFKIPTFQRDFVWGNKEKIELFDSISKEYPIGSILLWQPKEEFKNKEEIGPYTINNSISNDFFYILDGFQRLSTLFGCLTNPNKTKLKFNGYVFKKEFSVFYDLEDETFNMYQNNLITNIPVYVLIDTYEFLDYCDKLRSELKDHERTRILVERAKKLSSTLIDYLIPSIEILGGSIKDAVDIFSRINSKGITISQDWMLSALTSSEEDNFNLGDILGNLLSELKIYNFDDIKRDILVQCIASSFGKIFFDQKIENLAVRNDFKSVTIRTIEGIKKAVQFLFEELLVIDRKLLPYNNQLIFLSYFFTEIDKPTYNQKEKLKEWFWITSYSNYFTINSLSKIRLAFEKFKKFIINEIEDPIYYDNINQSFTIADLPNSVSQKSVRSTSFLLFLLNYSNNFKRISSYDIDSLKLASLFNGYNNHANIFPIIQYVNDKNQKSPLNFVKQKDMSYLFYDNNFSNYSDKYFLTNEMLDIYDNNGFDKCDKILAIRMNLIQKAEKQFVEGFNISYNE